MPDGNRVAKSNTTTASASTSATPITDVGIQKLTLLTKLF